jgi:hypothetical protein
MPLGAFAAQFGVDPGTVQKISGEIAGRHFEDASAAARGRHDEPAFGADDVHDREVLRSKRGAHL